MSKSDILRGMAGDNLDKNSWAKGSEAEKQLSSLERAKIVLRRKVETHETEHQRRNTGDLSDEEAKQLDFESPQIALGKALLDSPNGTLHKIFVVKDDGTLDIGAWDPADDSLLLVELAMPGSSAQERQQASTKLTPDDVRKAAANLSSRYPDIRFTFHEDRGKKTFEYVAAIG